MSHLKFHINLFNGQNKDVRFKLNHILTANTLSRFSILHLLFFTNLAIYYVPFNMTSCSFLFCEGMSFFIKKICL